MSVKTKDYDLAGALDPAASVFVSANAGAGKTSLLASRVLRLLLHGVPPSKILCLTFTHAAAAEMMSRVQKELGAWVMADEAQLQAALSRLVGEEVNSTMLARARGLFAQVLEAPEGVRIQTIHGFCQSLLRRFPVEAGISPHFTVMDARTEQEMLQEARRRLFIRAQDHEPLLQEALHTLAHTLSEPAFHRLFAEILANKRRFRALFAVPQGVEAAIALVWRQLGMKRDTTLPALIEAHFAYDAQVLASLRGIAARLLDGSASDGKIGQGMAYWLEKRENALGYAQLFLTAEGERRKRLCSKQAGLDEAQCALLLAEQERAWRFHEARQVLEAAQQTVRLLHIAESLLALYEAQKRQRGLMDYDDLILTARDLLHRPGIAPWVLFKLDGGIDHILVDEAQDTSPEQWAIVAALTEDFFAGQGRQEQERSVFVVGDEKQSIFSFQGADPSGLGRMQRYFSRKIEDTARPVHRLALTHSFRSAREVLAAVDAVFAPAAARSGLMFEQGELAHIPTRLTHAGLVEIWPLIQSSAEGEEISPVTQLARLLADTIDGWLRGGLMLEAKDRPVQAGDIMILVRSRTSFVDRLVRALKKRGVPVAGQDRMALGDHLAVQDLLALGQCLLLPEDDLTLAALLKSPICNLSEEELFSVAYGRGGNSLWERLKARGGEAYALLADLRARADYVSPFELYAYLLDTLGARKRFTGRMGEETHDPIDEFLGQALLYERSHAPSLQGFIHWLQASDSEIKRDMEQARNQVRIMTVHGSKGLQAPIVILPDTVTVPMLKDSLLWHEGEGEALPFWPAGRPSGGLCAVLRERQLQAMHAEHRRLLYVALTRAEDRLYICGATGKDTVHEQSWYHLIKTGLTPLCAEFDMPHGKGLRVGNHPAAHEVRAQDLGKMVQDPVLATLVAPQDWNFLHSAPPIEPSPTQPLSPSRLEGEEPAGASPLAQTALYRRGTLIHKLLQYLPEVPPAQRKEAGLTIAAAYDKSLAGDCIRETCAVIDDPRFAFLFAPGSLAEAPIAGNVMVHGRPVTVAGQIDRLHIGAEEVWIADFKSNRTPPAATPPLYLRQMSLYRLLLRQIYPQKRVRCALIWTSIPHIDIVDDALLDEWPSDSYI